MKTPKQKKPTSGCLFCQPAGSRKHAKDCAQAVRSTAEQATAKGAPNGR